MCVIVVDVIFRKRDQVPPIIPARRAPILVSFGLYVSLSFPYLELYCHGILALYKLADIGVYQLLCLFECQDMSVKLNGVGLWKREWASFFSFTMVLARF